MSHSATNRPLILVASRDLTQASRRCAELSLAGWRTVHAEELMDTLAAVRGRGPSLVLAMLPMNDLPGADLPKILREIDPNTYLPVVVQLELVLARHGRIGRGLILVERTDPGITRDSVFR